MQHPTSQIECACGAHYEREVVDLPIKDVGIFECQFCDAELERWYGRKVPKFKLLLAPDAAKRAAS